MIIASNYFVVEELRLRDNEVHIVRMIKAKVLKELNDAIK